MADSSSDDSGSTAGFAVTVAIAVICVALRFYLRIVDKVKIAWDDWWILIGLLTALLAIALLVWAEIVDPDGASAIDNDLDFRPHEIYIKVSWITSILYFSMVTAVKLSILCMYRRIFSIDASFRRQSLMVGIVVVAFWLANTIASVANCIPLQYSWISLSDPRYCFNYNVFWMATGVIEVVIDTTILALPVRMVLGLQLSLKRKISIVLIFLLGGFAIITGIIRTIYGYGPGRLIPTYTKSELWSVIHIGCAVVCACLPSLRPLVIRVKYLTSTISSLFSSISKPISVATGLGFRARHTTGENKPSWNLGMRKNTPVDESLLTTQTSSLGVKDSHGGTVIVTEEV